MASEPEYISSQQNAKIKNVVLLQKKFGARKEQQLIVIEGIKELGIAVANGFEIDSLFFCHEIIKDRAQFNEIVATMKPMKQISVSAEVFAKIAYREDSGGVVALAKPTYCSFQEVSLPKNPLILVLDGVEKPGNLGAVLRTMDAVAADLLIVCDTQTDIYNPNVIRASIGCVFSKKIVVCSSTEAIDWLQQHHIHIFAAALQTTQFYHQADYSGPSALVFGTESTGLTPIWLKAATVVVKIPMLGTIDSLNVSNSLAIVAYEAKRQRGF
ncbi:MAG: RNA methyltransferase [Bacteroidota bacterium]